MHCFSKKLKKFNSALDILKEYYEIRLDAYSKEKIYLIKKLKYKLILKVQNIFLLKQ